jgi:hypothetical protein
MNADEMNWLLQTIEESETAKRFVQAQYERARISHEVMANLAREQCWTDCSAFYVSSTAVASATVHATTWRGV